MRDFVKNIGYFLQEVKTIFILNGFSSVLSLVSLVLIFFVALLAVSGWRVSTELVNALQKEAEISVYYPSELDAQSVGALEKALQSIEGVQGVTPVNAKEAYANMSEILGPEAKVLSHFDKNPFEAYFEVSIELSKLAPILKAVEETPHVAYVRDNQTVLEKLSRIATLVTTLGIVIAVAVGASTFIITSHIIREGVHSHRDQINTLRLLGAPDGFIYAPFILEGVLLTTIAGALASGAFMVFIGRFQQFAGNALPFLPLFDGDAIVQSVSAGMLGVSAVMGLGASLFGLRMVPTK